MQNGSQTIDAGNCSYGNWLTPLVLLYFVLYWYFIVTHSSYDEGLIYKNEGRSCHIATVNGELHPRKTSDECYLLLEILSEKITPISAH